MKCPICEFSNTAEPIKYPMDVQPIPGVSILLNLDALHCSHCGEQSETPEITVSNDKLIDESKLEWLSM